MSLLWRGLLFVSLMLLVFSHCNVAISFLHEPLNGLKKRHGQMFILIVALGIISVQLAGSSCFQSFSAVTASLLLIISFIFVG